MLYETKLSFINNLLRRKRHAKTKIY